MTEGKTFKLRYKEINPDNARINNMKIYKGKYILVLQRLIIHLCQGIFPTLLGTFTSSCSVFIAGVGVPSRRDLFKYLWTRT